MTRFYNFVARRIGLKSLSWGITFIVLIAAITNSSAQCEQSYMACNDFVQVSLDENCFVIISPDMVLENPVSDLSEYKVTVFNGRFPIGDSLTDEFVNRTLEVSVRCQSSGVSCWGYIGIEDKLPPQVEIRPSMVMLDCNTDLSVYEITDSTGNIFGLIDTFIVDNGGCEKIDSLTFMEEITNEFGSCGQDGIIRTITRTYMATDKAGNVGTADQVIVIKKAELSDITYPNDTIISCLDLPAQGFDPDYFGRPEALSCDIFKSTYTDTRFPLCSGSFKVLRTWIVVDWCDNRDTTVTQVLEALDTVAPVWNMAFDAFDPGRTYAGSQECTGSITLPFQDYAAASDLCTALKPDDYSVRYRRGDSTTMDGFEAQIRTDVVILPNGDAVISDLPLGIHQVIITATDACGNSSSAARQITIEDMTPPNAVCERTTTAVLDNTGISELMAFSLDDHSFDNCGIDQFEVKRLNSTCDGFEDDLLFGPSIHFCCDDIINNPIRVVLRVYDFNGRFSDCVVDVEVQDKRPVVLTCGSDVTVNCGFNFNNLGSVLGTPTVDSDLCDIEDPVLNVPDFTLDGCGNGMFFATWTVSDYTGIRDSCRQKVTVRNLSNPTISIPGNLTIEACDADQAHPAFIESEPTVTGEDCEIIASSHVDEVDDAPNTGCIRIRRTWTVIDWCTYDPFNPSTALRTGIQTITLIDNEAPMVLDCPEDLVFIDSDENCSEMVPLSIVASDNCTKFSDLTFAWSIDVDNDGTGSDLSGDGNDATDIYPVGTHLISWVVTDQCGNVSNMCSYTFTISNPFNPIFLGTQIRQVNIESDGNSSTLSIENFRNAISENCIDDLELSFASNEQVDELSYDCSDLDGESRLSITERIYVGDGMGNQRSFNLEIRLRDDEGYCDNTQSLLSVIKGVISDENDLLIPNVAMRLTNNTSGNTAVVNTDENGGYSFDNLIAGNSYTLRPVLTGNDVLGVSTLDLVQIQRHILGLAEFQSPYQVIASDVNNSKSISAADLVLLQKLILGIDETMVGTDPWRFVPSDHVFNQNDQFVFPEVFSAQSLPGGVTNAGFIALKVGDVNGNAFPALLDLIADSRSKAKVNYTIGQLGDNLYKIEFKMARGMDITGIQMGIDMKGITLVERENDALELSNQNIHLSDEGLRVSWSNAHGQSIDEEEVLFSLLVRADEISEIELERTFSAEVYDNDLNIYNLSLHKEETIAERKFEVFQNHPNPFSNQTSISFILPEKGRAELKVFDLTGKVILARSAIFDRGINQFQIQKGQLSASGVLYYTVETSKDIRGHKMILLQ